MNIETNKEIESYNLRNILHYIKSNVRFKKEIDEKYKSHDNECKNIIYDAVVDNVRYFAGSVYSNLNNIFYTISTYVLERISPAQFYELQNKFNTSATGFYGLYWDNQTNVCVTDIYGNPFILYCFKHSKAYEFNVYNMNGQGLLYTFVEPIESEHFSSKNIAELKKMRDYQIKYYDKLKKSADRYNEIKQYKDYIIIELIKTGYAHCIKKVRIKKNIPITLTLEEIAKYADDWNYCFGGNISKIGETDDEIIYQVKIHTD